METPVGDPWKPQLLAAGMICSDATKHWGLKVDYQAGRAGYFALSAYNLSWP
jgi:hypothetical protein